jgi:SAM-dependent methyltransferase
MNKYILPHDLAGEQQRLRLMSELLNPLHRSHIEQLGLEAGWRCLEVGCGNGSMSEWLANRVAPSGHVVASDIDPRYIASLVGPNLEVRQLNILEDAVEEGSYDLVTARAVLHHTESPEKAVQRMLAALKPGGVFLSIEPDMLPATATEPESIRAFWQGWFQWSNSVGIDYFVGRKMPSLLFSLTLEAVAAEGHTALYNGGSPWATYWLETLKELRPRLTESGYVTEILMSEFDNRYSDPRFWTSAITFIAAWGRKTGTKAIAELNRS